MDERTVLRKAKGVLLERGWHQGGFCADLLGDGAVCIAGAVKTAIFGDPYAYGNPTARSEQVAAGAVYRRLMEFTDSSIPKWNDAPDRTVDEVIALIDRALGSLPAEAPELEKETVHA